MNLLLRVREKFWFLPAVMCVAAFVLAESLVRLDQSLGDITPGPVLDLFVSGSGAAAAGTSSAPSATSSLAVAGTTFSITMAVLALTSSSYGPRLVRNFMADRGNQLVLGVYVATFLYSLLVLRSIRVLGDPGARGRRLRPAPRRQRAPSCSRWSTSACSSTSSTTSATRSRSPRCRRRARGTCARPWTAVPRAGGRGEPEPDASATALPDAAAGDGIPVFAQAPGYVQSVREDSLMRTASRYDVLLALQVRPGQYVLDDTALALVHAPAGDAADDAQLADAVRDAFTLANARSPYQDLEFAVQQLTEMAVRALSPGTNDPFTAVNALDDLSSGLALLAGRTTPSAARYDERGTMRLHAPHVDLAEMVGTVLDAMRWYATSAPSVMHTAVELAERVGRRAADRDVRARLLGELDLLVDAFETAGHHERDVEVFRTHVDDARREIARAGL